MSVQGFGFGAFPMNGFAAQPPFQNFQNPLNPLDPSLINLNQSAFQNPLSSINQPWMSMALAPTLGGLMGTDQNVIGFDWMQSVRQFASGIANGMVPVESVQIPGLSGLSGMAGTNGIALRYLMKSLSKKDPDSPEARKLEEVILKVGGGTPELKRMLLETKLENFDSFALQLASVRQNFPTGSPEANFIDARIQALQARKENTAIEAALNQLLGENPQNLQGRFIQEALGLYANPKNTDPASLAQLENRLRMLAPGQVGEQLVLAARTLKNNNAIISNFDTQTQAPQGLTVGNPLQQLLGSLGFLLSGGNGDFGGGGGLSAFANAFSGGGGNPLAALATAFGGGGAEGNPLASLASAFIGSGGGGNPLSALASAFSATSSPQAPTIAPTAGIFGSSNAPAAGKESTSAFRATLFD